MMNNLAELLALQGRSLDEARTLIDRAISLAGRVPTLLDTRSTVYLALGRTKEALADMQTVLLEEPRPNRHYHLARILHRTGQSKAAADEMKRAATLGLTAEQLHPLERADYEKMKALAP